MGTFLFFLFSFLRAHKKRKNANKQIGDFFPHRCFLSVFFIFLRLWHFVLLLGCVFVLLCFWCFWCMQNLFVKKNIYRGFKTALITSLILLLNLSYYKHGFFNNYNLFQSLQSFSIITIFFNHYNLF